MHGALLCDADKSKHEGQVGQESNRQPAVLETQSGVSGGVARHRQMPLCPTISVVFCRRLSPCVGGSWGTYWGSLCFGGCYPPALAAVPRRASAFSELHVAANSQSVFCSIASGHLVATGVSLNGCPDARFPPSPYYLTAPADRALRERLRTGISGVTYRQ